MTVSYSFEVALARNNMTRIMSPRLRTTFSWQVKSSKFWNSASKQWVNILHALIQRGLIEIKVKDIMWIRQD
jgi:hypothetical protein